MNPRLSLRSTRAIAAVFWLGACAGAPPVAKAPAPPPPARPCRPWILQPVRGRPDMLYGVGGASLSGPDPVGVARRAALEDIAEQIRVRVVASDLAEEHSTSTAGRETDSGQSLQDWVRTTANVTLEGAAPVDSCTDVAGYHLLLGVSRRTLAAGPLDRLRRLAEEIDKLDARARALAASGDHLGAARLYRQAAPEAGQASRLADFVRSVGRAEPGLTPPTRAQEERRAKNALAQVTIGVLAPGPEEAALLAAATSCITRAGLAAGTADTAELSVVLHLDPGTPSRLYRGLFMTDVTLQAALVRHGDHAIVGATQAAARGAADSAEAAILDGVGRLAASRLPGQMDRLFSLVDLPVHSCREAK